MTISSSEINILIQRYFQELGYDHSAFAFGSESKIPQHPVAEKQIPAGSLIYLIQKGIMFAQIDSAAHEIAEQENDSQFGEQINYLRANFRQSVEIADEVCQSTRRMKVFHTDQAEIQPNILSYHSSLVLHSHFAPISTAAWSLDGKYLAAGSCDGSVVVWSFDNLKSPDCNVEEKTIYLNPAESENEASDITALKWSETTLAVGSFSGYLSLYKGDTLSCQIIEHNTPIVSLDFIGEVLVSGSLDGTILISKDNAILSKFKLEGGELTDVNHTDDTKVIASCGNTVYLINVDGSDPTALFSTPAPIVSLCIDSKRQFIAAADNDQSVTYFKIEQSESRKDSIQKPACSLAFDTKGNYIVGTTDGFLKIITPEGNMHTSFDIHKKPPHSIAIDPKERFFATASSDGFVAIFDIAASKVITAYISSEPVNGLAWGPTGRLLCIILNSGAVAILDFDQLC
ncbi:hypothetical protein TVAG_448150 [Trichomonas vaginalis G3]|uniref:Uncharacterized protein n=1 Tax=Trichomonas vaginalis (strain ATCC PRA-98 / G3) TaxID=412133 RepID=A2FQK5_TRIV3|nr:transcription corepressor protein [Trichomonas vaginalis G3]EAX92818.1 hypothetical protein TVAG_448150 [Trichomonas vaginalis G3]KAI5546890.1 transcription corepressor protein [Trichomonas vaginalis G3]|eukprot:XP_001305748.1 hypothetical protein [Trichomonas vaginalis G3]